MCVRERKRIALYKKKPLETVCVCARQSKNMKECTIRNGAKKTQNKKKENNVKKKKFMITG